MPKRQQRILVVDDLADWRQTLSGLLLDAGYQVQVANSSVAALRKIAASKFDLALLDIRLDESDEDNIEGMQLAAKIKKRSPKTKIVIITGYGTTERMKQALEPDAQGQQLASEYVPKTQTESLVPIVQRVLAR